MAKLTFILVNPKNIAFMKKVAEFNNSKVDEGVLTVSVITPKLVIKREWADEIFGWDEKMPLLNGDLSYVIIPVKS
jgi:hypothetical protein